MKGDTLVLCGSVELNGDRHQPKGQQPVRNGGISS
jgi:hypothetical protein